MQIEFENNDTQKEMKRGGYIGGIVGFAVTLLIVYILMLTPSNSIFSIHTWIHKASVATTIEQLLITCLMPIYIALLIFGGAATGWVLGRKVTCLLFHR